MFCYFLAKGNNNANIKTIFIQFIFVNNYNKLVLIRYGTKLVL